MLLYLVKQMHPDLANATRKLSKANDGANPVAYKELLHVIKYVLDTTNLGLKIEPTGNSNEPLETACFSYNNDAGYPVSWRSISGFIHYVLRVLISWQLKLQKSSSEAE